MLDISAALARALAHEDQPSDILREFGTAVLAGRPIGIRFSLWYGDAYRTAQRLSGSVEPWATMRAAILETHQRLLDDPDYQAWIEHRATT